MTDTLSLRKPKNPEDFSALTVETPDSEVQQMLDSLQASIKQEIFTSKADGQRYVKAARHIDLKVTLTYRWLVHRLVATGTIPDIDIASLNRYSSTKADQHPGRHAGRQLGRNVGRHAGSRYNCFLAANAFANDQQQIGAINDIVEATRQVQACHASVTGRPRCISPRPLTVGFMQGQLPLIHMSDMHYLTEDLQSKFDISDHTLEKLMCCQDVDVIKKVADVCLEYVKLKQEDALNRGFFLFIGSKALIQYRILCYDDREFFKTMKVDPEAVITNFREKFSLEQISTKKITELIDLLSSKPREDYRHQLIEGRIDFTEQEAKNLLVEDKFGNCLLQYLLLWASKSKMSSDDNLSQTLIANIEASLSSAPTSNQDISFKPVAYFRRVSHESILNIKENALKTAVENENLATSQDERRIAYSNIFDALCGLRDYLISKIGGPDALPFEKLKRRKLSVRRPKTIEDVRLCDYNEARSRYRGSIIRWQRHKALNILYNIRIEGLEILNLTNSLQPMVPVISLGMLIWAKVKDIIQSDILQTTDIKAMYGYQRQLNFLDNLHNAVFSDDFKDLMKYLISLYISKSFRNDIYQGIMRRLSKTGSMADGRKSFELVTPFLTACNDLDKLEEYNIDASTKDELIFKSRSWLKNMATVHSQIAELPDDQQLQAFIDSAFEDYYKHLDWRRSTFSQMKSFNSKIAVLYLFSPAGTVIDESISKVQPQSLFLNFYSIIMHSNVEVGIELTADIAIAFRIIQMLTKNLIIPLADDMPSVQSEFKFRSLKNSVENSSDHFIDNFIKTTYKYARVYTVRNHSVHTLLCVAEDCYSQQAILSNVYSCLLKLALHSFRDQSNSIIQCLNYVTSYLEDGQEEDDDREEGFIDELLVHCRDACSQGTHDTSSLQHAVLKYMPVTVKNISVRDLRIIKLLARSGKRDDREVRISKCMETRKHLTVADLDKMNANMRASALVTCLPNVFADYIEACWQDSDSSRISTVFGATIASRSCQRLAMFLKSWKNHYSENSSKKLKEFLDQSPCKFYGEGRSNRDMIKALWVTLGDLLNELHVLKTGYYTNEIDASANTHTRQVKLRQFSTFDNEALAVLKYNLSHYCEGALDHDRLVDGLMASSVDYLKIIFDAESYSECVLNDIVIKVESRIEAIRGSQVFRYTDNGHQKQIIPRLIVGLNNCLVGDPFGLEGLKESFQKSKKSVINTIDRKFRKCSISMKSEFIAQLHMHGLLDSILPWLLMYHIDEKDLENVAKCENIESLFSAVENIMNAKTSQEAGYWIINDCKKMVFRPTYYREKPKNEVPPGFMSLQVVKFGLALLKHSPHHNDASRSFVSALNKSAEDSSSTRYAISEMITDDNAWIPSGLLDIVHRNWTFREFNEPTRPWNLPANLTDSQKVDNSYVKDLKFEVSEKLVAKLKQRHADTNEDEDLMRFYLDARIIIADVIDRISYHLADYRYWHYSSSNDAKLIKASKGMLDFHDIRFVVPDEISSTEGFSDDNQEIAELLADRSTVVHGHRDRASLPAIIIEIEAGDGTERPQATKFMYYGRQSRMAYPKYDSSYLTSMGDLPTLERLSSFYRQTFTNDELTCMIESMTGIVVDRQRLASIKGPKRKIIDALLVVNGEQLEVTESIRKDMEILKMLKETQKLLPTFYDKLAPKISDTDDF